MGHGGLLGAGSLRRVCRASCSLVHSGTPFLPSVRDGYPDPGGEEDAKAPSALLVWEVPIWGSRRGVQERYRVSEWGAFWEPLFLILCSSFGSFRIILDVTGDAPKNKLLAQGLLLVWSGPDPKMVVRNNGFCGRRRHRRFWFRHTAGRNFFARPYVSIPKILRILWRIPKWMKNTKKDFHPDLDPGRTLVDGSLS